VLVYFPVYKWIAGAANSFMKPPKSEIPLGARLVMNFRELNAQISQCVVVTFCKKASETPRLQLAGFAVERFI
jgi:hypothetical protein